MPIRNPRFRRTLLALGVTAAVLATPATVLAAKSAVDVRVVDSAGGTLAQQTVKTGTVKVKTDPEATCFGAGTGGDGSTVTVSGPTALGALQTAAARNERVNPLSVTNAFEFGLGVCGIGDAVAPSTGFWYLKVNHSAAQAGGDQTSVRSGDQVLWYLDPDFSDAPPAELELRVPRSSRPGSVPVRVFEYSDDGTRAPAEGAEVTRAEDPTDAKGKTTVVLGPGANRLQATRGGTIPSPRIRVIFPPGVR